MRKLCNPSLVVSVIFAFVLAACGKPTGGTNATLTESQAFNQISDSSSAEASSQGADLQSLLEQMLADGQVKVPVNARAAFSAGSIDLSLIGKILELIQGGQATNAFSLAAKILELFKTNSSAKLNLATILSILQQAAPIIAVVAPQYAAVIAALVAILPLVISFLNIIKKPVASLSLVPRFA